MTKRKFHSIIGYNVRDFHPSGCSHGRTTKKPVCHSDIPVILCRTDIMFLTILPCVLKYHIYQALFQDQCREAP